MPHYAYRWENGSVSVLSANDRDKAFSILDQFGETEPERLIQLKSPIVLNVKPDIEHGWCLDYANLPLSEELDQELLRRCYPRLDKALSAAIARGEDPFSPTPETRAVLENVVREDAEK